ncbi:MAG: hypothetical protein AAF989_16060, partial [Planctomycetota bacterium]
VISRAIQDGTWQTMMVKVADDGKHWFSECLALKYRKGKVVNLTGMPLLPGVVLNGRLSENVPRPVLDGYVIATCAPVPAERTYGEKNPTLVWHDWTEVRRDGSFTFESLPRGGKVQLISVTDSWLSKSSMEGSEFFVRGQLFDLGSDETNVTIEMVPTGTLELTVEGVDGEELQNASISASPNQIYFKGGSTVLGRRMRTTTQLRYRNIPLEERNQKNPWWRFDRQKLPFSDAKVIDGRCTLTGLPLNRNLWITMSHAKYVLDCGQDGQKNRVEFNLADNKPKQLTVRAVLGADAK